MKIGIFTFYGLNEAADSDANGLRGLGNQLSDKLQADIPLIYCWNEVQKYLNQIFQQMSCFDFCIGLGHSFGGAALKYIGDKIVANNSNLKFDYAGFLDFAPNPLMGQYIAWFLDGKAHLPKSISFAENFYQRNDGLLGGCLFKEVKPPQICFQFDVSNYDPQARHHSSMPYSAKMRSEVMDTCSRLVAESGK